MIPNPILKVLSSIQKRRVRALLMGGQACVLYGAAEFSRDADFAVLANSRNLERLRGAMADLQAEVIAVPPFEARYLQKGHAVHFRCRHPDAAGLRVDVMTKMRGVESFSSLWARRSSISLTPEIAFQVLSLPDLVRAKKTQRDKDWPMIRRLVETNYFENRDDPTLQQIRFWLMELRTPELLIELVGSRLKLPQHLVKKRPLLKLARSGERDRLLKALQMEEAEERKADRAYWAPLRVELEASGTNESVKGQ